MRDGGWCWNLECGEQQTFLRKAAESKLEREVTVTGTRRLALNKKGALNASRRVRSRKFQVGLVISIRVLFILIPFLS